MDAELREQIEKILLKFADAFSDRQIPEDTFEDVLHDALDAIEALFRSGPVEGDWLVDEFDIIKDTYPSLSHEELLKKLAVSINTKLRADL